MNSGGPKPVLTKSQSELIDFLLDAQPNTIRSPLTEWIAAAPRYAEFVEKYKDKIRKKLRITREPGAAADLFYELQIPYWLLQEKRFEVAYEPYFARKTRSPDFSVTYRTHFTFNIEVTHIHSLPRNPDPTADPNKINQRLVDAICRKLRQLLANMANLVFIVPGPAGPERLELPAHIAWIKDKAERSDPAFYARHRFASTSDFIKHYERLSGLAFFNAAGEQQVNLWLNPQARVKLNDPVRNILQRGFSR